MIAEDLVALNGLIGRAVAQRQQRGDKRDEREIATEILADAGCPEVDAVCQRIAGRLRARG